MRFPTLSATTLSGEERRLPDDLPSDPALVLLAFRQWQQRQVDAWMALAAGQGWTPDLSRITEPERATIEVPCLGRRWRPARRLIDGGMAASIRSPEVLARTWTVYTDVDSVRRRLGIPDPDQTWALVVTRAGEVRERAAGDPTEQGWARIGAALQE